MTMPTDKCAWKCNFKCVCLGGCVLRYVLDMQDRMYRGTHEHVKGAPEVSVFPRVGAVRAGARRYGFV